MPTEPEATERDGETPPSSAEAVAKTYTGIDDEITFLTYQQQLREGGTKVLDEAMLVLDIIDAKAASLLSYISISLAALVFLITSLPTSSNLQVVLFDERILTIVILAVLLALLAAMLLCLSCINIVGAHTIRKLRETNQLSQEGYERLIVKVTCSRRYRYLVAHRISISTATIMFLIFGFLIVGAICPT